VKNPGGRAKAFAEAFGKTNSSKKNDLIRFMGISYGEGKNIFSSPQGEQPK
jgi:hypothetical protein